MSCIVSISYTSNSDPPPAESHQNLDSGSGAGPFRGKSSAQQSGELALFFNLAFAFIHYTPSFLIELSMSRQRKKKEEEEEVQVVDEAPQVVEEVQAVEEDSAIGPHSVSLLQVCFFML